MLDDPVLRRQLVSLERRTTRGGREQIDHPPGKHGHDDRANIVALLAVRAEREKSRGPPAVWVGGDPAELQLMRVRAGLSNGSVGRPAAAGTHGTLRRAGSETRGWAHSVTDTKHDESDGDKCTAIQNG